MITDNDSLKLLIERLEILLDRSPSHHEVTELIWRVTMYGLEEVTKVMSFVAHYCLNLRGGEIEHGSLVDFWFTLDETLFNRFLLLAKRPELLDDE